MLGTVDVRDSLSNRNEQIEAAARAIGTGNKRVVFEAIYFHKNSAKTITELTAKTKLTRHQVLNATQALHLSKVAEKTKVNGELAYRRIDFLFHNKDKILKLAGDKKALELYLTKRSRSPQKSIVIRVPKHGARVKYVTIDEIDNFKKVRRLKRKATLDRNISEDSFKNAIKRTIGEPGTFKDWGGEKSDLFTTRLKINSKRFAAAFAFKGPGLNSKLVPGKMGKNGDQALKLLQEDAEVFFVQHWREIDPTVNQLLHELSQSKSVMTGKTIYYGVIDGLDSERLHQAYKKYFKNRGQKRRRKGLK